MALIAPTAVSLRRIDCRAKVAVIAAEAAPAFWRLDAEPRPPDCPGTTPARTSAIVMASATGLEVRKRRAERKPARALTGKG
jgi:hypothetical protein